LSSLLRKTGRGIGRMDTDEYTKQFEGLSTRNGAIRRRLGRAIMESHRAIADGFARNRIRLGSPGQRIVANKNDVLAEEQPEDFVYTMLYRDLVATALHSPCRSLFRRRGGDAAELPTAAVDGFEVTVSLQRTVSRHRQGLG
jgi:putative spermidine/putrescine transport system permease protein